LPKHPLSVSLHFSVFPNGHPKKNLTMPEAARRAGKTERAYWQDIYRKRVPYRRWEKRIFVPEDELEKFLTSLPSVSAEEAMAKIEGEGV
jgi:hypothetical protein